MIASGPVKPEKLQDVMPAILFATMEGKLSYSEYFSFLADNIQQMTKSQLLKHGTAISGFHYDQTDNVSRQETEEGGALTDYFSSSDTIRKDHSVDDIRNTMDELIESGRIKEANAFSIDLLKAVQTMANAPNPGIEFRRDVGARLAHMGGEHGLTMDKFNYKEFGLSKREFKREQCFGALQKDWDDGKSMDDFNYQKYGVSEKDFRKEEGYIALRYAFDYGEFAFEFNPEKFGFTEEEFKKHEGFIELNKALNQNKPLSDVDYKKYGISDEELQQFKDSPNSKMPGARKTPELLESEIEKPHYYRSSLPKEDYEAESYDDLAAVTPSAIARKNTSQMQV